MISQYISSGVTSSGVYLLGGHALYVESGGVADNTTVNEYGYLTISSGGVANSTTVNSSGYLWIFSGGVANSTTVNSDGKVFISSGGTATAITENGGYVYVAEGANVTFTPNTISGLVLSNASATLHSGTVASSTTVNSGGNLWVYFRGTATSTTVNSSGNLGVNSDGTANSTTVNSGGRLVVNSGGVHRGSLQIESGAVVSADSGSIIDFTVADRTTADDYLINNLALIDGAPTYTITVSADQAAGTYKLAAGASGFADSITVYADGTSLGSLSIGQSFTVNDVTYKLNLQNDLLLLSLGQDSNSNPNVNDKGFAYGGNCDSTLKDDIKMLVDDGSYKRFYGGNYVEKSKQFVDIAGSIDLTVNGGTFSSVVAGGDHVVDGIVERTGSITVVINGGTFANNVAGGMCLDIAADNFGKVNAIANDINLTITGGTFAKRVFGGNISAKVAQSGHADVKGNINLTIDATASDITFSENIAAGSSGYSWVHGNVTVTLKKSASYTLDMQGLLSGGGEGAVYVSSSDGSRSATSYVAGERSLVLDSYVGEFAGTLFMFESLEVKNNTAIEFTNEKINLRDIDSWDIEYGSSLDGIARNNFTGDTLDFDLTGWNNAEDWIVMSGSENAFDTIAEAENVILGGQTATWNGSAWASADYSLTIEENNQKLVLAKVNA